MASAWGKGREKRLFERRSGLPLVTLLLTVLCLAVYILIALLPPLQHRIVIEVAGVNPSSMARAFAMPVSEWHAATFRPLLAALFVHVEFLHLLGNLAYLWVFGIPIERLRGALFLLLVFILGGAGAYLILAQRLPQVDTIVIGASGAVSAVLGAYLGLFPGRQIGLYLPLGLVVQSVRVPALLVIGSWFALQLLYSMVGPISGMMAWWIHLTGFALGLMLALLARAASHFRPRRY
ncbi:rhomboid family intramembrane serine protease [Marinihelvus fidelis]|uniref:Rhomboid family intramembrane serine protease n=1 Tax=Marinihelvus fidelis TaxID=2613842 RepID=A0A5N0TAZ8_9GAMM|nr:rhomboid family intramembrane serine protease [Marinihelvus fidelis]KAA9131848.1 rhomboid family intramembrane serine protease [Marinihelvus fidelis]